MTALFKVVLVGAVVVFVVGCSNKPSCDSEKAKEAVKAVLKKNLKIRLAIEKNIFESNPKGKCMNFMTCYQEDPTFKEHQEKMFSLKEEIEGLQRQCEASKHDMSGSKKTKNEHPISCYPNSIRTYQLPPNFTEADKYKSLIEERGKISKEMREISESWQYGGELYKQTKAEFDEAMKSASYSFDNIHTKDKDESTDAVLCTTTLEVKAGNWGSITKQNMMYTIEQRSDGSFSAMVTF